MSLHLLKKSWIGIGIGRGRKGRVGRGGGTLAAMMPSGFATWAAAAAEREWEALSGWLMLVEREVGGGGGHAYVDCFTEYKKLCCWILKNLKVHFVQIHDPVCTEWRHSIIRIILRVAPYLQCAAQPRLLWIFFLYMHYFSLFKCNSHKRNIEHRIKKHD